MSKEQADPWSARRSGGAGEWTGEHERRKRNWSEQERKWRKERRHPAASELDETQAPPLPRGFRL